MKKLLPHSLIFAPLEGITDDIYREVIAKNYEEWDFLAADFFRVPRIASSHDKIIKKHLGPFFSERPDQLKKIIFQILTSQLDDIEPICEQVQNLGITCLDLNAGCPMKRVVFHKGGSYLLSSPPELQNIISRMRKKFSRFLSVKIRIGLTDDKNFFEILRLLEGEGVDAITLHGRLQTQMYQGKADWDYISKATKFLKIPLIGNGDILTPKNAEQMYKQTNCHSLMIGRGAMRAPWLAGLIKSGNKKLQLPDLKNEIKKYLTLIHTACLEAQLPDDSSLCRIKSLCPTLFDDFQNSKEVRQRALRARCFEEIREAVEELSLEESGAKNK